MFSFVYEAAAVVIFGFAVLRLAGKKVMAEMTTLEMITVLSIGTLIGHAVTENELWKTLVCIAIFVIVLIIFQLLALKFSWVERVVIGRPTLVIRDGQIQVQNLKKLRMTVEQLELRLRQNGISRLFRCADSHDRSRRADRLRAGESAQPLTRGQAEQILSYLKLEVPLSNDQEHKLFENIRNKGG